MKFSELKQCPKCGCTVYDVSHRLSYSGKYHYDMATGESYDDVVMDLSCFTETIGVKAYCSKCGLYLGNTGKDIGKEAQVYINKNSGV